MYNITSDLTTIFRRDLDIDNPSWVTVSGYQGTWVTLDSGGKAKTATAATKFAFPIWNESNRDGTVGFTKDVTNAKKVTVVVGKHFATTDKFSGTPAIGEALVVQANTGLLVGGTTATLEATGNVVAYTVKAKYAGKNANGTAVDVIDIMVI